MERGGNGILITSSISYQCSQLVFFPCGIYSVLDAVSGLAIRDVTRELMRSSRSSYSGDAVERGCQKASTTLDP